MNKTPCRSLSRCSLHWILSFGPCPLCEQESSNGMEPGSLGNIRGERLEDVNGKPFKTA